MKDSDSSHLVRPHFLSFVRPYPFTSLSLLRAQRDVLRGPGSWLPASRPGDSFEGRREVSQVPWRSLCACPGAWIPVCFGARPLRRLRSVFRLHIGVDPPPPSSFG